MEKGILTVEEIRQRYPDEWVCLEVREEDEQGQPRAGRVVAHDREKRRVVQAAKVFRATHPGARGFLFYTGELIPEGQGVILPKGPLPGRSCSPPFDSPYAGAADG